MPALGQGYRLRLDLPGGGGGTGGAGVAVGSSRCSRRSPLPAEWPEQRVPRVTDASAAVRSGDLQLLHDGGGPGSFELRVAGKPTAIGLARAKVGGAVLDGKERWTDLPDHADVKAADAGLEELR